MPCPYGWGDGGPWADGWCCGGLGTAARCPYVRSSPLRLCALCVFALNGGPWADGWCCGGLGTAARCPYGWRPLRLCVNVLCVKRCAVRRRVALWGFGHGSAVGRRVVLWGFGHGSAVGRRVALKAYRHGMPCPYGWGTVYRAPAGGVVGVCQTHAGRRVAIWDGVPCAGGWCCGGLGTACRAPTGGGRCAVGQRVVLWVFGHGRAVPLRAFVPSAPLRPLRLCVNILCVKRCAVRRRVALKAYGHGSVVPLRVGGRHCRGPTGGVVGVWARQGRAPTCVRPLCAFAPFAPLRYRPLR
jgi:hypothetical protein